MPIIDLNYGNSIPFSLFHRGNCDHCNELKMIVSAVNCLEICKTCFIKYYTPNEKEQNQFHKPDKKEVNNV